MGDHPNTLGPVRRLAGFQVLHPKILLEQEYNTHPKIWHVYILKIKDLTLMKVKITGFKSCFDKLNNIQNISNFRAIPGRCSKLYIKISYYIFFPPLKDS